LILLFLVLAHPLLSEGCMNKISGTLALVGAFALYKAVTLKTTNELSADRHPSASQVSSTRVRAIRKSSNENIRAVTEGQVQSQEASEESPQTFVINPAEGRVSLSGAPVGAVVNPSNQETQKVFESKMIEMSKSISEGNLENAVVLAHDNLQKEVETSSDANNRILYFHEFLMVNEEDPAEKLRATTEAMEKTTNPHIRRQLYDDFVRHSSSDQNAELFQEIESLGLELAGPQ